MATTRTNGSLYTHIQNGIATLEFGHPASNSFTAELLQRLTRALQDLAKNDEVSVIVLKSEGERAFCAGASFDELVAVSNLEEGTTFFSGFAHVINAMRLCPQPIVARVQGKSVGGGVGLLAACDYVMATEGASIRLSELTIGIGPLVIAPAVERKVGKAGLAELSLSPTEWKSAYWAQEKGLMAKVLPDVESLDKEVLFFTEKLSSYNPEALAAMKQVLWEGTENWDRLLLERAEMSGRLVLSEFTKKALAKFSK
ncbi:enoyl-CoA hydratase/isomerase family protein [Sediminicola luteus]|uniref:Enoyl-CoA hydratase n=1 Tax=Sediminicola luteus TaxID=319238 RepID=A0A2A4G4R2_9FLAO|nr:enoyl-CoA hydratase/isomerase family protein [Sediminicola luteus]PCE62970.1 enoyl-CoA hydratase [Sediminicola luteus]